MSRSMTKAQLVQELASRLNMTATMADQFLNTLNEIAYREAPNGFIIPNLCKIEVVDRKARRCRDPRTGAQLMIGARKGVRVKPLKKARDTIAPTPDGIVTVLDDQPNKKAPDLQAPQADKKEEPITPTVTGHPPPMQPKLVDTGPGATPEPPQLPVVPEIAPPRELAPEEEPASETTGGEFIYFRCHACKQEIEAPTDMVGLQAECPACEAPVTVQTTALSVSTNDIAGTSVNPQEASEYELGDDDGQSEMDEILLDAMKKRTIRIELPEADTLQAQRNKKFVFRRPKR